MRICTLNQIRVKHPKITKLPIGLAIEHVPPLNQEKDLIEIQNNSSIENKIIKCYIDFSYPPDFYRYKNDRIEALSEIPEDLCFMNLNRIERIETWKNQSKYAFVVSPHGNGLDCHRTWEALILNCIPIVKTSGIDDLYDDLPVLIVNKWSDINEDLLKNTYNEFKTKTYDYDKLLLNYWKNKINSYKKIQIENFTISHTHTIYYFFFVIIISFFVLLNYNYFCVKGVKLFKMIKNKIFFKHKLNMNNIYFLF